MKFIYDSGLAINVNDIKQIRTTDCFVDGDSKWIILIYRSFNCNLNKDNEIILNKNFKTKIEAEAFITKLLLCITKETDGICEV